MSEAVAWRDMASAPKDATEIILRIPSQGWPDHYAQIGHWAQDLSGEEQPPFRGWFRKTGYGCAELADPTGWRPLFGDARPVEERFDFDAHSLKVDLAREIKRAETAEAEVKRLTRERDCLAEAIAEAAVKAGTIRPDAGGLTGPQLMAQADYLADVVMATEAALAKTRERLEKVEAAARPFVDLASPRHLNEGGSPSLIDIMTDDGEQDEIELRGMTSTSARTEMLHGYDFRDLLAALTGDAQEGGK